MTSDPALEEELLPAVFFNLEYPFFFNNMKMAAEAAQVKRNALSADSGARFNLSGVWCIDKSRPFDYDGLTAYAKAYKLPWAFRKIFESAAASIQDVCVVHTPEKVQWNYKLRFFGNRTQEFLLDGKEHIMEDIVRKMHPQVAQIEGNAIVVRKYELKNQPPGSFNQVTWSFEGDLLKLNTCLHPKGAEPTSYDVYFRRQES